LVVLIFIVGMLELACTGKRSAPVEASTATGAHNGPQRCPTYGTFPEPSASQVKGEHKVILFWDASTPGDAKHGAAVGYCIYRAAQRDDKSLIRLNSLSFPGTGCTDDMVETGKTYFYKVRALSANEKPSDATDFASAAVLDRAPIIHVASPPPLCRDASQSPTPAKRNTGQIQ
jgi:hypothetical protein